MCSNKWISKLIRYETRYWISVSSIEQHKTRGEQEDQDRIRTKVTSYTNFIHKFIPEKLRARVCIYTLFQLNCIRLINHCKVQCLHFDFDTLRQTVYQRPNMVALMVNRNFFRIVYFTHLFVITIVHSIFSIEEIPLFSFDVMNYVIT